MRDPCLPAACHKQDVFQNGYGSLLDSGTTFSYLPTPAFNAFVAAVTAYVQARGLKSTSGPDTAVRGGAGRPRNRMGGRGGHAWRMGVLELGPEDAPAFSFPSRRFAGPGRLL